MARLQYSLKFACKFIPWYLQQVDKLTSKKYAKELINLLCAGDKVFVKYQAQGSYNCKYHGMNSPIPHLRTPLIVSDKVNYR